MRLECELTIEPGGHLIIRDKTSRKTVFEGYLTNCGKEIRELARRATEIEMARIEEIKALATRE